MPFVGMQMATRTKLFSCLGYALRTSKLLDVPETTRYLSLALHALQNRDVQKPECLLSRKTDGRTTVSLFDALNPVVPTQVTPEGFAPETPEAHGCVSNVQSELGKVIQQQCRSMVGDAMEQIGHSTENLCEVMSKQDLRIQELQDKLSALSEQSHQQILQQERRMTELQQSLHSIVVERSEAARHAAGPCVEMSSCSSVVCHADSVARDSEVPAPTTECNTAVRPRRKADETCQGTTLAKQRRREDRRQMLLGNLNM